VTDSLTQATLATVQQFNEAFDSHDVQAIMSLMTGDCVFESTRPPPDGERVEGRERVEAYWTAFFQRSPQAHFEAEEVFATGDRCVVRWIYRWVREGQAGHVRGVDLFRVTGGRVAEKLSYVKG